MYLNYLIIFMLLAKHVWSARILGIWPLPSYSHHIVKAPFIRELSKRGHEMVAVTTNVLNDSALTNLTEIDVSYVYSHNAFIKSVDWHDDYKRKLFAINYPMETIIKRIFEDKQLKKIYQNNSEKFDLVIVEDYYPLIYALCAVFKAPIIVFLTTDALMMTHSMVGNPQHPILYADILLSTFLHLTMYDKIKNTYYFLWNIWYFYYRVFPRCDVIARKYFGNDIEPIIEATKNISMLFFNLNHYQDRHRPLSASAISLEFLHLESVKPLPLELQEIMDKATNGVVYLSLGTNVKSSTLTPELIKIMVKTLSELPYTVLWKWETDDLPEISDNVVTRKWFPQQDVLAHPNVKVFVTQGGLQSVEEAISRVVPLVGIPFIADQNMNVHRLQEAGVAIHIDWRTVTSNALRDAIITLAQNKKYKEKMQEIKDILMDQPMTGLEKAVWWTEYVIRHKGAKHLRSILADTPLWEYLMLDVLAVVLGFLIVSIYTIYKLISCLKGKIKAITKNKVKVK